MNVDFTQVGQASQVVRRQSEGMAAVAQYLPVHATIPAGDLGLLLQVLHPLNTLIVGLGVQAAQGGQRLLATAADALDDTLEEYAQAERVGYDETAAVRRAFGAWVSPFEDPRTAAPPLGPATDGAPPGYGDGEPDLFSQAYGDGGDLARWVLEQPGRARDRVTELTTGSPCVSERQDVTSYLVPPVAGTSEIEEMRWSAGAVLGSLDWVFEQFMGWSFLEDVIFKPFAGDWDAINRASIAWEHAGDAVFAVAENLAPLPEATRGWDGDASEMFRAAAAALSAAALALSRAAGTASGVVGTVGTVSRLAAVGMGMILRKLSEKLMRLAIEASVPVAGWVVAAAEAALLVNDIVASVKLAYTIVNLLYDAIADVVEAQGDLVDTAYLIEDLARYLGSSTVRALT